MGRKQGSNYSSKISDDYVTKIYQQAVQVINISISNMIEKSLIFGSIYDTLDQDIDKEILLESIGVICPDCEETVELLEYSPCFSYDKFITSRKNFMKDHRRSK